MHFPKSFKIKTCNRIVVIFKARSCLIGLFRARLKVFKDLFKGLFVYLFIINYFLNYRMFKKNWKFKPENCFGILIIQEMIIVFQNCSYLTQNNVWTSQEFIQNTCM